MKQYFGFFLLVVFIIPNPVSGCMLGIGDRMYVDLMVWDKSGNYLGKYDLGESGQEANCHTTKQIHRANDNKIFVNKKSGSLSLLEIAGLTDLKFDTLSEFPTYPDNEHYLGFYNDFIISRERMDQTTNLNNIGINLFSTNGEEENVHFSLEEYLYGISNNTFEFMKLGYNNGEIIILFSEINSTYVVPDLRPPPTYYDNSLGLYVYFTHVESTLAQNKIVKLNTSSHESKGQFGRIIELLISGNGKYGIIYSDLEDSNEDVISIINFEEEQIEIFPYKLKFIYGGTDLLDINEQSFWYYQYNEGNIADNLLEFEFSTNSIISNYSIDESFIDEDLLPYYVLDDYIVFLDGMISRKSLIDGVPSLMDAVIFILVILVIKKRK